MASWVSPTIHATGDDFSVTDNNTLANNEIFLYQRPYIAAYNSVSTSLAGTTATQVTLGGLLFSGYGFSVSSNNIVVPLTGIYQFEGALSNAQTTGFLLALIYQNGSSTIQGSPCFSTGAGVNTSNVTGLLKCTAGDTVALWGYNSNGGAVGTSATATTFLHGFYLGSQ